MSRPVQTGRGRNGSALLIALWALLLLSASLLAWIGFLDKQIEFARQRQFGLEARAMAFSGLTMAMHQQVRPGSELLHRDFGDGRRFDVTMEGEGGKLNLNWLLASEDPARLALLKQFLANMGLDYREQDRFVDSLLDWVDADDVKRLNGIEEGPNYKAPNRPLQSVQEVRQVAGSEPLVSIPGWEYYFTILSRGPIDLLSADLEILGLLPGLGDARAEQFIEYRRGADGEDYTLDDPEFENMEQVRRILGYSEAQFEALAPLVTIRDATWRIESRGEAAKVYRHLEVVARNVGDNARILSWKEY